MISRRFAIACLVFGLSAIWSGARAEPLRLENFFKGNLTGTGEVENHRDGTRRSFKATMRGSWAGETGTLVEDLVYDDGENKHFAWSFEKSGADFIGHRDDLIGDARITQDGDGVRMAYKAKTRLPNGQVWNLSFDDRFTKNSATTVTLKGDVSYLFLGVGVTHMTITKSAR